MDFPMLFADGQMRIMPMRKFERSGCSLRQEVILPSRSKYPRLLGWQMGRIGLVLGQIQAKSMAAVTTLASFKY